MNARRLLFSVVVVFLGSCSEDTQPQTLVPEAARGRSAQALSEVDPMEPGDGPLIFTNKSDYAPGDTAIFTGTSFHPHETVTLLVTHVTGGIEGGQGHEPFTVTTDNAGSFSVSWYVNPDDSEGALLKLTVSCAHGLVTDRLFTDKSTTVTLNAIVGGTGWYKGASHTPGNENFTTGFRGTESRGFFIFDLGTQSGTVTDARVVAKSVCADGPGGTLRLWDVSSSVATVTGANGGIAVFNDLGSGVELGTLAVPPENVTLLSPTVVLNAAGRAAVGAAVSGHTTIVIGATYGPEPAKGNSFIFGCTRASSEVQLVVTLSVPDDTTAPMLNLPSPVIAEATGSSGAVVTYAASAVDDKDGAVPVTCSPASGATFALGTTTVRCSATDAAGNQGSDVFTVTVRDTIAPVISGAPASLLAEAVSPAGAPVSWPPLTANDAVRGALAVSCAPSSGTTFPLGTAQVTCSAQDGTNAASITFGVTVVDTTAPVLFGLPGDQLIEAQRPTGAYFGWTGPNATDVADPSPVIDCAPAPGEFALGPTTVRCTATDSSGNGSSGTFTVRVVDTTPPTLSGLPVDAVVEATGPAGAAHAWTPPAASDLVDGAVATSCSVPSGSTFPLGVTTVVCGASDAAGNANSQSFTVSVVDTTAPELAQIPAPIIAEATSALGAIVTYASPVAADLVDGATAVSCVPTSGSMFSLGDQAVICTSADARGNSASASFSVSVRDTTPPAITQVPAPIIAEATSALGASVPYATPIASDLVDGATLVTCVPGSGSTFAIGDQSVNCTTSDARGNSASASFTVSIRDTTPPELAQIPAPIIAEATSALGASVGFFNPIAVDLVDGATPVTCVPASGSTFALGEKTVTCTTADARGNSASASFAVTVRDTTPPALTQVPAPITAEATSAFGATVSWIDPAANDLVDGATAVSCTPASGSSFALGSHVVSCATADSRGNGSAVTFTIDVRDTTAPALIGVPSGIVAEATGPGGAVVQWNPVSAVDLVDGAVPAFCALPSGAQFALGSSTVTCTAADSRGNVASAQFVVLVRDTTPPQVLAPSGGPDQFHAFATSAAGAVVNFSVSATDLVSGPITPSCTPPPGSLFAPGDTEVVCTAVDAAGNVAQFSYVVSVTYSWSNLLPPISNSPVLKLGRTVPVKFALTGPSAGVSTLNAKLYLSQLSNGLLGSIMAAASTSGATTGNAFRYDRASGEYIFNLSTRGLTPGEWVLQVDLGDGHPTETIVTIRL